MPDPLGPTKATYSPAWIWRFIFFNTCTLVLGYAKYTFLNWISPLGVIWSIASGAYFTNDSYFSISNTPSKAPVALIILAKDSLILELAFVNYIE